MRLFDEPPEGCVEYLIVKSSLMSTTWGQGNVYNTSLTPKSCTNPSNGKPWTGCIATSMAQIMKYHGHPTSYSWGSMPNNPGSANTYINDLMGDAGSAVGMNWQCSVSLASSSTAASKLKTSFSYTSASYTSSINYTTAINNLNNNRPLIFGGYNSSNSGGHAWVADGYRKHFFCDSGLTYLFFEMNWGWDNSSYNGLYGVGDFTPGSSDYSYSCDMIYDIYP